MIASQCQLISGCDNKVPSTCKFSDERNREKKCEHLKGQCDSNWYGFTEACKNTPGKVRENCRITCGTCYGK